MGCERFNASFVKELMNFKESKFFRKLEKLKLRPQKIKEFAAHK